LRPESIDLKTREATILIGDKMNNSDEISTTRNGKLINLAERAFACRHWQPMPGMLSIGGYRISSVGENHAIVIGYGDEFASSVELEELLFIPDLSDVATLGCLQHLVREAWGADYVVQFGGWTHVAIYPRDRAEAAWAEGDNVATEWDSFLGGGLHYGTIKTEAEALVAALMFAPVSV
jgi:hypothetical protein